MKSSYARALPFACNIAIRPGDVVFAVDRAGRFVYWNRNAQAVIGRSPATVAGLPLAAVFPEHEGGPDRARLDLSAVMAGRDYAGAFRASRADGSPVTLYVYATAGRAKQSPAGADPAGVVFVARDVTNQVEVEQAARLKDELYRQVLRLAHDVVLVLDESGRVLEPNRALSLLTGIPEEELFGSPLAGMLAPGGREAAEGELSRLWEHGEAVFSLSFAGRAGQKVRVDFNASVLGGQARRLAVAVGRDASGPEQVRQQVKTAELKSRRVFEAVRDGVLLHMLAGQVLDVNEGACRLFGYLREELLGINVERLFPRDSLAGFLRLRDAILRSGEFYGEGAGRRRDGTELPVELSCSRLALGDETLVITLVRDITERRRAEQAVRESEELHRLTLNAMSDPAHVIDREHNILLANDALLRLAKMLGVESDPIGGKLFELFPFLEEQVRPATERVFETGRPVRLEEAYIIGGQRREAEVDELPVFEAGKVTRVLTVIRDITARKRQEEMLERLAGAATGFLELPPDADIYLYAADRLAELLPGITFAVSVYDEAAATLTVRRIAGLTEEEQAGFRRTLSEAHEGAMLARVGPAVRDALVAGVVREVAGGVYGAMLERVPEPVCREVERRLGIERVLSVGLHRENRLYGSVTFFLRGGRLLDRGLVEAFAGQWAIALERREVQQALAASEERYSSLFYNSPIGIYRTTPDGRMLMANPALVGMLGLDSFEELARMNVAEASYRFGYDREEFKRRIAVSGEITGLESVLTLADGTRRYIRENARAVRGPDGAVAYYDGTVEDLTERHQAEERARAERARAETYLEVAGVVILALDEQGLVSLVNRRGCELLDTTEDEALGSDWVERFVPAADREKTRATFAALMRGELELAEEFENRVLTATGEARLVHWHNVLLRDPEGKTIGTLSSGEDITERRAAEEALREREQMLQDLRDNVPVGLFRTTPDGRFLAVNPAGVRLAGYESEAEMLGTPVAALYADPGKRDELRALL
ncbi:MAG: PAS domain S-box protein, partial [bacterium]